MCPRAPLLRSASLARQGFPVCHADGGAGPGESEEREVVLAGTASKTDSLGAPARETACRRGKREGSAITRRPDASPPQLFTSG